MAALSAILIVGVFLLLLVAWFVFGVRDILHGVRKTQSFFASPPVAKEMEPPGNEFIESKPFQRFLGLVLMGLGAFGTLWVWRATLRSDGVRLVPAVFCPFIAVLGLGGAIFPLDFEAQRWKYGRSKPRTWGEMPMPMKVACVVGLLTGIGNLFALNTR